jgi:phage terminase large subunit GpA-like protein
MMSSDSQSRPDSGARPKSMLHCPECGHESSVDGDWHVERRDATGRERVVYWCPECGHVITTRPTGLVRA